MFYYAHFVILFFILHVIKGVTVESMVEELNEDTSKNLFQLWDELNTFVEQFGMYIPGADAFDRSIYNSLYNGEEELQY